MTANNTRALTKRQCDAAAPKIGPDGRPRENTEWDGAVSGFGLRVSAARAKSFVLVYRAGRGRAAPLRKVTIGRYGSPWTVELARQEARRLLGQVHNGRDPAAERTAKRARPPTGADAKGTVRVVVEEWLRRDQSGNRTAKAVRRFMEREVLPAWGDRPLAEIRKRDVLELLDRLTDRGAGSTANRALAHVRRLMNWAASRDLIEANPAQFVERPKVEIQRDRVLDDAELVEVWRAVEGMVAPFTAGVRLLILTGARRSEVFESSRGELVAGAIRLPAERSKNDEGRLIHLSPPALAIVEALPTFAGKDWLLTLDGEHPFSNFGHAKAELDRRILAARQKATGKDHVEPMPPWRLHDLRRSVATGMQRLGVRLEVIEAVLGHVSGSRAGIVGVYQRHRFEAEARDAVKLWGEHVARLLDPKPAKVVPMRRRGAAR